MNKICPFILLTILVMSCHSIYEPQQTPKQPSFTSSPTKIPMPSPAPSPTIPNKPIFQKSLWIGRGVNLGNALEAPEEGAWGVVLQEEYFQLIKDAGFNSVRIPVRWSAHADQQAPFTIQTAFFDRVDWAVNQAISRDLTVVLNMHHYEEIYEDPKSHAQRFLALWAQISDHYKNYSDHLFFELLNEPHNALILESWNHLAQEAITLIRKTNPDRPIIVGPGDWNSISHLDYLKLPEEDQNLIVTFHYYQPFRFTHQGAEWVSGSNAWLGTRWNGSDIELQSIRFDFLSASLWGKAHNRPIYLGEFGAYSKADIDSRALWTSAVARTAEAYGFTWAYWEFCAGFGVYDPSLRQWNLPIKNALLPDE